MANPPFDVRHELDGWTLHWTHLELTGEGEAADLEALRAHVAERARQRFAISTLAKNPTVAAVRRLFRQAGCDPTRYRPSSEALLRRLLKSDELPAIHPLVDLSNALSVELTVPCSAVSDGTVTPPIVLRAGRDGETYASLRGPFNLAGKPLLADAEGPFSTPITDSQRTKATAETRGAWLVAYLPREAVSAATATATVQQLLDQVPQLGSSPR